MVQSNYQSQIEQLAFQVGQLKKKSNVFLLAKLLFFGFSAFLVYLTIDHFTSITLVGAIASFMAYLVICSLDSKCQKKIETFTRMQAVCRNELAYLSGDFSAFSTGECYLNPEHAFSFDLDLFGPSSLFHRIHRCVTQKGSDRLAQRLTTLSQDKQDILRRQKAIAELSRHFQWRIKFMSNVFIPDHSELFSSLLPKGKHKGVLVRTALPYVLASLAGATLVLASLQLIAWNVFALFFLINLGCSILFFNKILVANLSIGKLHKELLAYVEVLTDVHNASFESPLLVDLKNQLFSSKANSLQAFGQLTRILNLFDQRANAIVYVIFNGLFLFDVLLLKRLQRWEKEHSAHMDAWLDAISEVDALVSWGNYAYNNPTNTTAELLSEDDSTIMEATDVYHPFLAHKHAVPNSFTLRKGNVAIVTGANMAGKSTFLRTIGLNYILACNGVPVCATAFKCSIVTLFSSMRTTDNLSKDISYFNAELLRLKQLIEHIKTHPYTLIILDEILKGTNSKDKLEGSKLFLQEIIQYPVAALIATHDLELAKLEEENNAIFTNYCFEIELSKQIAYTYRISKGVARNLNASFLLRSILQEMRRK